MVENDVFLKKNIFYEYNNWSIIGVLSAIVLPLLGGLVWLAYIEGERSIDYKYAKYEIEIMNLGNQVINSKKFGSPICPCRLCNTKEIAEKNKSDSTTIK